MKKYEVLVIYPGMYSRQYDVLASSFEVIDGVYYFWQNGVLQCTFPAGLTIIEKIKEHESDN